LSVALVWSSSDTTVATVSSSGVVRSVDVGEADITVATATSASRVGAATAAARAQLSASGATRYDLVVSARASRSKIRFFSVPRILLTPKNPTINQGDKLKFSAFAVDATGHTPDRWSVGPRQWRSSAPSIGSIDATGLAAGVSAGTTKISATMTVSSRHSLGPFSASTTLTVALCGGITAVHSWNVNSVVSTYHPGTFKSGPISYSIDQTSAATGGTLAKVLDNADTTVWHGTVTGPYDINNSSTTTIAGQTYTNTEVGKGNLSPKADVTLKVYHAAGAVCTYWMEYSDLATYTSTAPNGAQHTTPGLLGDLNLVANVPAPPAAGQPWVFTGGGAAIPAIAIVPLILKGTYYLAFTDLSLGAAGSASTTAQAQFQFTANAH
jgi:hypothetical protein